MRGREKVMRGRSALDRQIWRPAADDNFERHFLAAATNADLHFGTDRRLLNKLPQLARAIDGCVVPFEQHITWLNSGSSGGRLVLVQVNTRDIDPRRLGHPCLPRQFWTHRLQMDAEPATASLDTSVDFSGDVAGDRKANALIRLANDGRVDAD